MAWLNPLWLYRTPFESQNAKVAAALSHGHFDISDLPSATIAHIKNGGGDIRITTDDEVSEVAREVVTCDTGAETGELHFDTTGILTGSDVLWYLYYGNAAATDHAIDAAFGAENVWAAINKARWHAKDTAGNFMDSTDNDHDGTFGGSLPDAKAAKLGNGQDFDGDDNISEAAHADFNFGTGDFALVFWTAIDNMQNTQFLGQWVSALDAAWSLQYISGEDKLYFNYTTDGDWTHAVSPFAPWNPAGSPQLYQIIVTRIGEDLNFYINGAVAGDTHDIAASDLWESSDPVLVGGKVGYFLDGVMDEVAIIKGAGITANEALTIYNNENEPSTFWSIGAEEQAPSTGPPLGSMAMMGVGR